MRNIFSIFNFVNSISTSSFVYISRHKPYYTYLVYDKLRVFGIFKVMKKEMDLKGSVIEQPPPPPNK